MSHLITRVCEKHLQPEGTFSFRTQSSRLGWPEGRHGGQITLVLDSGAQETLTLVEREENALRYESYALSLTVELD